MKRILALLLCIVFSLPVSIVYSADEDPMMLLPACINQDGATKWGYINLKGEFVIQPEYDNANDFTSKGIAIVSNNAPDYENSYKGVSYFINREGKKVLGPFDSLVQNFYEGFAIVNEDEKGSKLIDEGGNIVLTSKYSMEGISEGLISFYENKNSKRKYGFMDTEGNIRIPAKYQYAGNFYNGSAHVTMDGSHYFNIDTKGDMIKNDEGKPTGNASSLVSFMDQKTYKYGYKSNGKIVIEPKFLEADEFMDGKAVVAIETKQYEIKFALINPKGEYIIKPQYACIHGIGEGLYAVGNKGHGRSSFHFYPNAIFNSDGKQLSDFIYYNIGTYNGEYVSASSETQTFFIDKNARKATNLPTVDGVGTLEFTGGIIKAQYDNVLSYYHKDGSLIWKENTDNTIVPDIKVKRNQFRPNYNTYIEYPEIQGFSDVKVQEKVNKKLAYELLGDKEKTARENVESDTLFTLSYQLKRNKNLLTIKTDEYLYPIGAAHGSFYSVDYPVNLKTGEVYTLKNLFKNNAKYKEKLTSIVRNQIAQDAKIVDENFMTGYVDTKAAVTDTTGFTITRDALTIYFCPDEIAPHARGVVSFDIPYGQIIDIIDTKGTFWNAFEKTVVKRKVKLLNEVTEKASKSIQSQIKLYENKIIEAVNCNDFKKVAPLLYTNSSLYNAQKALVKNLSRKGIKEKLKDFEVYAIGYVYDKDIYKVYVIENIEIKVPSKKNSTVSKFNWCYTVKYDKTSKSYQLSSISKW